MNIAIINNLYEPFARGGAERIAKLQFEGLLDSDYKVITISLKPHKSNVYDSKEHFYISSIFPNLNKLPKFLRLFWHIWDTFNFVNYFKIKKILATNNIDFVISHNMTGIGKLSLLHIAKEYKHLHVLHDIALLHPSGLMFYKQESIIDGFFAAIYQKINRAFFKYVGTVISPSKWLLDLHVTKGFFVENTKKEVIMNPVKISSQSPSPLVSKNIKILNFLYVGLIAKHKGVGLLIDSWEGINKPEEAKLSLVGECRDEVLKEKIENSSNVEYLGPKEHGEVSQIMQAADCLIMPSICYENSPTVIYEAASLGLPIIASSLGGASELVNALGGHLFEPTKKELMGQLELAIKNPTIFRDEMNNSRKAVSKYSVLDYAKKIKAIIENID